MMSPTTPATLDKRYHHGDLRNAVIDAALELLEEKGVGGVTLRQCAARAGVSHGAPGHHFGDLRGVLTAIAAIGFDRLVRQMQAAADAADDERGRLLAMGLAYIDFAIANRAHFSLMFQRDRLDENDPALKRAADATYSLFREETARYYGRGRTDLRRIRYGHWSMVHGYASLSISGQIEASHDFYAAMSAMLSPPEEG